MTDDQQLIAEARKRAEASRGPFGFANLLNDLADALSAAAVRYRAEGWDEGARWMAESENGDPFTEDDRARNPYRPLLDENNETQEGKQ